MVAFLYLSASFIGVMTGVAVWMLYDDHQRKKENKEIEKTDTSEHCQWKSGEDEHTDDERVDDEHTEDGQVEDEQVENEQVDDNE